MTVNLGDKVRDTITDSDGIVTGIAEYITGVREVMIAGDRLDVNGIPVGSHWLQEWRIELVEANVLGVLPVKPRVGFRKDCVE